MPIFRKRKGQQQKGLLSHFGYGVCCCHGNELGLKTRLKNGICLFTKKIQSLDFFFSAIAHYEFTLNPFCQHCPNKIMTEAASFAVNRFHYM